MREIITLACETCKDRNYTTSKNKTRTQERFAKKKFCPRCNAHTPHKETK